MSSLIRLLQPADQQLALEDHFLRQIARQLQEQLFLAQDLGLHFLVVHRLQLLQIRLGDVQPFQVQILRPGLRSLGRRLALGGAFEDVDHELLALAWEQIRTYRIDRRPAAVAANILLDVRKRYVRAALEVATGPVALENLTEARSPVAPSAEHEALDADVPSLRRAHERLVNAVGRGRITATSAAVVWRTRVQQDADAEVAAELGVDVRTLQRRRQRAERALATAS